MTKNALLDTTAMARIERVMEVTADIKRRDRERLKAGRVNGYRLELESDRQSGVRVAVRGYVDEGTVERQAKGDLENERSDTIRHKRSRKRESALDRYRRRGELHHDGKENYRLWHAGHKLRGIFRLCKFEARVTADLMAVGGRGSSGSGVENMTNAAYQARFDYKLAMAAVGTGLAPILVHVCCMENPANTWAASYCGGGKGDGLPVLRLALQELANHFRPVA